MKKISLSLIIIGFAGLLVSAAAQDNSGDNNPPPPPSDAGGPPPGGEAGPDAGPPVAPPEMNGDQPAETAPAETADTTTVVNSTNGEPSVIMPGTAKDVSAANADTQYTPPATGTNADELRLNFRNAPLEMVLNYLSDAAGFIIVLDTRVNGNVSVISSHPMTRDEAVDLLNAVLNKNGYAAIRNGRTLTIVDKNDAKTRDIPVKTGNLPDQIPNNAEIVTQIIPIRFVEARQLVAGT